MSKPALCATRWSSSANSTRSASWSTQPAASATCCGWMPWMRTFHSWKWSCPSGGRMSHPARSTTLPSRTLTSPTEQADAAEELAVSKSMAVKSRVTFVMLARATDAAGATAPRAVASIGRRSAARRLRAYHREHATRHDATSTRPPSTTRPTCTTPPGPSYPARPSPGSPRASRDRCSISAPARASSPASLVDRGLEVTAVDPSPEMLRVLRERLPGVRASEGHAERIPSPDAAFELVLAAQAWHWVDPARAVPEVARVLRPGGRLGLVWNERDESVGWVARAGGVDGGAASAPSTTRRTRCCRRRSERWRSTRRAGSQELDLDGLLDLARSRSYFITKDADGQAAVIQSLRRLLREHPDLAGRDIIELPYVTRSYRAAVAGLSRSGAPRCRPAPVEWTTVALTIAIVGLPNVGKSTLFNALTKNDAARGELPVRDHRAERRRGEPARPAARQARRAVPQ